MTKKELSQYYYLDKQYREAELELERLNMECAPRIMPNDDMPHAQGGVSSPSETLAIEIVEQEQKLNSLMERIERKRISIWDYINQIETDDPYLSLIIQYRCLAQMSWNEVAAKMGYRATPDSVRMYYERHLDK